MNKLLSFQEMTKSKRCLAAVAGRPQLTPAEKRGGGLRLALAARVTVNPKPACFTTQLHSQAENINANSNVQYVVRD